jgi:flagellar protein FlgJ
MPRIDALAPTEATRPTAPLANGGAGAGFGRMFGEVQAEVAAYIQHGDGAGTGDGGAGALSPEGALLRARANGLIMGAEENEEAAPVGGAGLESPQQRAFLESIAPWAREAAGQLGVAPELVAAHAALESGWGQRPLTTSAGASSHNLFGIKAGSSWNGAVTDSATTEYVNGSAIKTRERFRAYPDAGAAFRDYAQMLIDSPRYRGALNVGGDARAFAQGLARGGYATDPGYAAKLTRLANQLQGSFD